MTAIVGIRLTKPNLSLLEKASKFFACMFFFASGEFNLPEKIKPAAVQYIKDHGVQCPALFSWAWVLRRYTVSPVYMSLSRGQSNAIPSVFSSQASLLLILLTTKKWKIEWTLFSPLSVTNNEKVQSYLF